MSLASSSTHISFIITGHTPDTTASLTDLFSGLVFVNIFAIELLHKIFVYRSLNNNY